MYTPWQQRKVCSATFSDCKLSVRELMWWLVKMTLLRSSKVAAGGGLAAHQLVIVRWWSPVRRGPCSWDIRQRAGQWARHTCSDQSEAGREVKSETGREQNLRQDSDEIVSSDLSSTDTKRNRDKVCYSLISVIYCNNKLVFLSWDTICIITTTVLKLNANSSKWVIFACHGILTLLVFHELPISSCLLYKRGSVVEQRNQLYYFAF